MGEKEEEDRAVSLEFVNNTCFSFYLCSRCSTVGTHTHHKYYSMKE